MMGLVILASVAVVGLLPELGELPPQTLAAGRCVTFLWTRSAPQRRIAMVDEAARTMRLLRDGKPVDLASTGEGRFAGGDLAVALDLDMAERSDVTNGGIISQGAMRVEMAGRDSVVVPVGGIRACS